MNSKERRKQIIVGLLAVIAVAVLGWNLLGGKPKRGAKSAAQAPSASGSSSLAKGTPGGPAAAKATAPTRLEPSAPIEVAALSTRFPQWVEAPARDPFLPTMTSTNLAKDQGPPPPKASERLVIRAIWRQSGNRLAVVNDAVLGEGDRVAGYLVEKIDASQIWVRGTNGFESVDFLVGAPKTPRVPAGSAPKRPGAPRGTTTTQERRLSP